MAERRWWSLLTDRHGPCLLCRFHTSGHPNVNAVCLQSAAFAARQSPASQDSGPVRLSAPRLAVDVEPKARRTVIPVDPHVPAGHDAARASESRTRCQGYARQRALRLSALDSRGLAAAQTG